MGINIRNLNKEWTKYSEGKICNFKGKSALSIAYSSRLSYFNLALGLFPNFTNCS